MKSFLAILALAFLATASAQDACAECQGHVTDLLTYLTTPDEIAEEIALLKAVVCPTMPDPAACGALVDEWWEIIATAMVNDPDIPPVLCNSLGECRKSRDFDDCDSCTAFMMGAGAAVSDPALQQALVEYLEMDATLCGNSDLSQEQVDTCKADLEMFMPPAAALLADTFVTQADRFCADIWGAC